MSLPVNLNPLFLFFKQLGTYVYTRLALKSKTVKEMQDTIDCVYVLYVISTGLIDDV